MKSPDFPAAESVAEAGRIRELASVARRVLEPGLRTGDDGNPITEGACLHASMLVWLLASQYGFGRPTVRGAEDGARRSTGEWCGHYWTEISTPSGEVFVVDTTADQFGFDPIVVLPLSEAASRYRPGPQAEVDAAFKKLYDAYGFGSLQGDERRQGPSAN